MQTARDHVFEKIGFEQNESIATSRSHGLLNGIENLAGRQKHSGLTSDPNAGVQRGNEYFKLFGTVLGSDNSLELPISSAAQSDLVVTDCINDLPGLGQDQPALNGLRYLP